jgi:hypothetical protein
MRRVTVRANIVPESLDIRLYRAVGVHALNGCDIISVSLRYKERTKFRDHSTEWAWS